jgi:hypothetical protein
MKLLRFHEDASLAVNGGAVLTELCLEGHRRDPLRNERLSTETEVCPAEVRSAVKMGNGPVVQGLTLLVLSGYSA